MPFSGLGFRGLGLRVYLELDTRDATHAGRSIAKHGIAVHR